PGTCASGQGAARIHRRHGGRNHRNLRCRSTPGGRQRRDRRSRAGDRGARRPLLGGGRDDRARSGRSARMMQFYLSGYRPGDPSIEDPHPSVAERSGELPESVDVLIVGCGPAGLVLAAQMANFPDIRTAVIDRRDGPLAVGQADGVACRTVEMFEAFGLADRLLGEAYWVNEVSFWRADPDDPTRIKR